MNEVRHVLTALRSPSAKSATLSNGAVGVATATWYDVPAPIIVHCREFREDAGRDVVDDDHGGGGRKEREILRKKGTEKVVGSFESDDVNLESFDKVARAVSLGGNLRELAKVKSLEKHAPNVDRIVLPAGNGEALYQNNAEAAALNNGLNKVCAESCRLEEPGPERRANDRDDAPSCKRRSTTVELNATTTVITDSDGVPTISFSFLRADERFRSDAGEKEQEEEEEEEEIVVLEVDTSDRIDDSSGGDQRAFYDLPKNPVPAGSPVPSLERSTGDDKGKTNKGDSSSPTTTAARQDLYDVPRPTRDGGTAASASRDEEAQSAASRNPDQRGGDRRAASAIVLLKRGPADLLKRSTRSLRSGRRSYGASDSDGYDAGIASMSGSYSDPECSPGNEAALSVSGDGDSGRSKRLKLQKRRLGKAWSRMRSWLREERTKIGEVVNRHARMQAVGALNPEVSVRWKSFGFFRGRKKITIVAFFLFFYRNSKTCKPMKMSNE